MEYVHKWLAPRRTGIRASFWDEMREASRKVAEYEARRAAEAGTQRAAAHPARSADAIRANHRAARAAAAHLTRTVAAAPPAGPSTRGFDTVPCGTCISRRTRPRP